ncbi:hypothetical protein GGF32_006917 [Allomyces javanicus]|nr:hypothetical protein GGF32_006917 [Allomyces javanicus]
MSSNTAPATAQTASTASTTPSATPVSSINGAGTMNATERATFETACKTNLDALTNCLVGTWDDPAIFGVAGSREQHERACSHLCYEAKIWVMETGNTTGYLAAGWKTPSRAAQCKDVVGDRGSNILALAPVVLDEECLGLPPHKGPSTDMGCHQYFHFTLFDKNVTADKFVPDPSVLPKDLACTPCMREIAEYDERMLRVLNGAKIESVTTVLTETITRAMTESVAGTATPTATATTTLVATSTPIVWPQAKPAFPDKEAVQRIRDYCQWKDELVIPKAASAGMASMADATGSLVTAFLATIMFAVAGLTTILFAARTSGSVVHVCEPVVIVPGVSAVHSLLDTLTATPSPLLHNLLAVTPFLADLEPQSEPQSPQVASGSQPEPQPQYGPHAPSITAQSMPDPQRGSWPQTHSQSEPKSKHESLWAQFDPIEKLTGRRPERRNVYAVFGLPRGHANLAPQLLKNRLYNGVLDKYDLTTERASMPFVFLTLPGTTTGRGRLLDESVVDGKKIRVFLLKDAHRTFADPVQLSTALDGMASAVINGEPVVIAPGGSTAQSLVNALATTPSPLLHNLLGMTPILADLVAPRIAPAVSFSVSRPAPSRVEPEPEPEPESKPSSPHVTSGTHLQSKSPPVASGPKPQRGP